MPLLENPPLVAIVGPTGVGKTEISIQLAEKLGGEIVSADSRLFYRGLDVGTAKPTSVERSRIPHHLIDIAEPDQVVSLALFQEQARRAITEIHNRRRLPFLVGGTGQYVRAVIQGWDLPKVRPDLRLRQALENWAAEIGSYGLYHRLVSLDPLAAEKIDPRNQRRTVRALEVILCSGRLFSAQRIRWHSPYRLLLLGLNRPRDELYTRLDARLETMLASGFVAEVQNLLTRGYSPDLPALSAIGYREIAAYLQGKVALEEAILLIKRATRTLVRRQANWFKTGASPSGEPAICWFPVGTDTVDEMHRAIDSWLAEENWPGGE
jgi:tRNA dimethylallyltransferase